MKKVFILVEGQTEEKFIKELLVPYFENKSIYIVPIIVSTSRRKSGSKYKGGVVSFWQVKSELLKLLKDSSTSMVTTMIDYYGLDNSFPGKSDTNVPNHLYEKIQFLENCLSNEIKHRKFFPYYQLHEFETLLFSEQEGFASVFKKTDEIQSIFRHFTNPEEINDNRETAPSKRILKIYPKYQKVTDGIIISKKIGIEKMRQKCHHFNDWIISMENINE
jgi:hypothetical protein